MTTLQRPGNLLIAFIGLLSCALRDLITRGPRTLRRAAEALDDNSETNRLLDHATSAPKSA